MVKTILMIILSLVALMLLVGCAEKAQVPQNTIDTTPITPEEDTGTSAGSESINPNAESPNTTLPDNTQTSTTQKPPVVEAPPDEEEGITLAELSGHDSEDDCWVAYDGEVYDITKFLPVHPGGVNAIARYCGTASEFQQAFTKKHGTSKVSRLKMQAHVGAFQG